MPTCLSPNFAPRRRRADRHSLGAALGAGVIGYAAGLLPAMADDTGAIESIVVTASKRPQTELSMPASVSVLNAEDLARDAVLSIEDLGRTTPNVAVAEFGDGQYRLIYRGIGATGTSDNQNFNVAYDGTIIPYGNAYRLLDLQRVEILRGPQGTLYGRNTNAGLINIVPEDGRAAASSSADVYFGSFGTMGASAAVGGPVDESGFFFRIAARGEQSDGYISDPVAHRDDSNRNSDTTLRATAGWDAGPWTLKGMLTMDRYHGLEDDLTPASSPYVSIAPDVGSTQGWLTMPIVTLSYAGESWQFTSVTAFADTARLVNFSAVITPLLQGQYDRRDEATQEFRLSGDSAAIGDNTGWIVGLFLMNDNDTFTSTAALTHPIVSTLLRQNQYQNTKSEALFGEATTDWSERWRTTIGLRAADEQQKYAFNLSAKGAQMRSSQSYPTLQPKAALSYLPDKDSQIYASISRGFRSGAVFVNNALQNPANPAYKQEGTWQYELGVKKSMNGGHLALDADIYYIDWSDLQVQRSILSVAPPGIFSVVDNATSARSYGAEGSLSWLPADGLRLYLKGGSTDAHYTDFHPSPTLNYSGNRIEEVPDYSVGLGAVYKSSAGVEVAADATRFGSMEYDSANSLAQKPYTLVNASIAYNDGAWRVSLTGRNLLDEKYGDRGLTALGKAYIHAAAPASVMGEISVRY